MDEDYLDRIKRIAKDNRKGKSVRVGICAILCVIAVSMLLGAGLQTGESFAVSSPGGSIAADEEVPQAGQEESIAVHVAGAVESPGVYEMPKGARVADAITAAGGFHENADENALNLARILNDGEQIVVPEKCAEESSPSSQGGGYVHEASRSTGKLNINFASANELETLPGIGPALAQRIVEYRNREGCFGSVQDLKRVSGIGSKKLEAIQDLITV